MAELKTLQNRTVLVRIALKTGFMILFAGARPHMAEAMEQLLSICALMSAGLALSLKERWSRYLLTRWDEALFFLCLSFGVRVLAGS